jgi:uncharacterized protein YegP (UPF0339 family)
MPHPRFRITKGKSNEFFFNLTAANGEIILQSQRYASHSGAVSGVTSVKGNAGEEGRFQKREARDGSLYFVLVAKNGEVVATSEMYSSATAREAGMESVKVNALAAGVEG